MIVTIGNTKGGVGKTTLALNIALGLALRGRDVWLIDGDRQGTASTAIQIRGESGVVPVIACAQYTDGAALMAQVKHQAGKFQDIVIDAGGRDSTALRAAIMLSDIIIVPFQPRSIDIWALEDISSLLAPWGQALKRWQFFQWPIRAAQITMRPALLWQTSRVWSLPFPGSGVGNHFPMLLVQDKQFLSIRQLTRKRAQKLTSSWTK